MADTRTESAVKIAVRECPSTEPDSTIIYDDTIDNIIVANDRPFAFDYVFKANTLQCEIFDSMAVPLVEKTLKGYNCNIFAYGQTGTGKTHTMGLSQNLHGEDIGIIPRCLNKIFLIESCIDRLIYVSYIEIYNEKVYDLLSNVPSEQVNIKGCKFNGGKKKHIKSVEEGLNVLIDGNRNRHVRPTKLNAQSSRSHAIVTIHVQFKSDLISCSSVLNLIDLAGTEGVRRTGHQGIALSEGVNINQGLLSVGKVIQALNAGNKVIPYRDSILTSVLQDSLNSNSYLTLLACVSSKKIDSSETLSTLRFAQNAKSLRNNPLINSVFLKYQKQRRTPYKKSLSVKTSLNSYENNKTLTTTKPFRRYNSFSSTPYKTNVHVTKIKSSRQEYRNQTQLNGNLKQKLNVLPDQSSFSVTGILNISSSTNIHAPIISPYDSNVEQNIPVLELTSEKNIGDDFFGKSNEIEEKTLKEKVKKNTIKRKLHYAENRHSVLNLKNLIKEELRNLTIIKNITKYQSENNDFQKDVTKKFEASPSLDCSVLTLNKTNSMKILSDSLTSMKSMELPDLRKMIREELISLNINNSDIQRSSKNSCLQDEFSFLVPQPLSEFKKNSLNNSSRLKKNKITSSIKPRRSERLSTIFSKEIQKQEQTKLLYIPEMDETENRLCRTNNKNIIKGKENTSSLLHIKSEKPAKKRNNGVANYFDKSCLNETKNYSKNKHKQVILEILNNGTIKDIQILPRIGSKTAFQIITFRRLNGKFKNLTAVSKIPVWGKNGWERFKNENYL